MAKLLPQLDQIAWHDTGVHSLLVDFSKRQFTLLLDCYDEALSDYVRWEAIFQEVEMLEWGGATGNDVEVCSLDVSQAGELYQAQLSLLTHHGPSATISFRFGNVTLGPKST